MTYEQKAYDAYLDNARSVSDKVYVPLAVYISKLNKAYYDFRVHINFDKRSAAQGAVNRFKSACRLFEEELEGLLARGASAYMTLALDEEIQSFRSFLRESLEAKQATKQLSWSPKIRSGYISLQPGTSELISILVAALTSLLKFSIPFFTLELEEETIALPITSREFEKHFQQQALTISSLIKEVTLGSRASPRT